MARCKRCGAKIRFLETKQGKLMPVNWSRTEYIRDQFYGKERIFIAETGEVISCRFPEPGQEVTGTGFVPHFATCGKEQKNDEETN